MKNWKKGREEQRKFYGVKLGSKQSIISTLASLFLELSSLSSLGDGFVPVRFHLRL